MAGDVVSMRMGDYTTIPRPGGIEPQIEVRQIETIVIDYFQHQCLQPSCAIG